MRTPVLLLAGGLLFLGAAILALVAVDTARWLFRRIRRTPTTVRPQPRPAMASQPIQVVPPTPPVMPDAATELFPRVVDDPDATTIFPRYGGPR